MRALGHAGAMVERSPATDSAALGWSDEDRGRLDALVTAARERQAEALAAAIDGGLDNLPRLLRGPVRKALF